MATLPRHLPLTGADYFVCALDRQMRAAGLPGNVCRLVVRLEGEPDPTRLDARLARSPAFQWLGRARMVRPLPFLPPRWGADSRAAAPALRVTQWPDTDGLDVTALPERRLRPGESPVVALDLLKGRRGVSHLVLTWHHALMDVRGAELLVRHLGGDEDPARGEGLLCPPQTNGTGALDFLRGFPRTAAFARESLAFITTTCRDPLLSLHRTVRPAPAGGNRYRVHWFDADETARVDERCRGLEAGFRRSLFYLAASVQALHGVATRRGGPVGDYVVPVPHDLRRRGAQGPILSNHLSFLFFRVEAALAGDLTGMIRSLTEQMLDQVRGRTTESFRAAMELFRPAPLGFYLRQLGRPTGGKFATFFFSDAGESCPGLEELAGAQPTAITHLAPAADPPGLAVVFSRFRGRLCAALSWVAGRLGEEEVDRLEAGLVAALLGEEAP